jgi:hypothetical protein
MTMESNGELLFMAFDWANNFTSSVGNFLNWHDGNANI